MFTVKIDGTPIEMEKFSLSDSIEQFVCQYQIEFYSETLPEKLLTDPNTKVEIFYKKQKIKTCFIDEVKEDFQKSGFTYTISGRGSLCDLVDSSVYFLDMKNKIKYVNLIKKMVGPFNVEVINNTTGSYTLTDIQFEYTEKTFEAINKHAKNFGIILDEDSEGRLVLSKPAKEIRGEYTTEDFKSITYQKKWNELFKYYLVIHNGKEKKKATRVDKTMRMRLLTKKVDKSQDVGKVATYMRAVRKAQSEFITIPNLETFEFKDGTIIETNSLIRIITDRIDGIYMVTGYSAEYSKDGISTSLTIKRREGYTEDEEKGIYD